MLHRASRIGVLVASLLAGWLAPPGGPVSGAASAAASTPADALVEAIATRLALIEHVARYKWNAGLPVVDEEREAALLATAEAQARALGMPVNTAREIVAAQMQAARDLQSALFVEWTRTPPSFPQVRDLGTDLRPAIERATRDLLSAAREARSTLRHCPLRARLETPPPALADRSDAWRIAVQPFLIGACEP